MVKQIPDQSEEQMRDEFTALLSSNSIRIEQQNSIIQYPFWSCAVNQRSDAIGYWIGELPNFYAYIVVEPMKLGGEAALEVIRAWVDPDCRGRGMFPSLLNCAASSCSILVGDREGLTRAAFDSWENISEFTVGYYDSVENKFVSEKEIPKGEKYSWWSNSDRWLITLTKTT